MSATERSARECGRASQVSREVVAVPMRELLAACAAASTISTPPRLPDRELGGELDGEPGPGRDRGGVTRPAPRPEAA